MDTRDPLDVDKNLIAPLLDRKTLYKMRSVSKFMQYLFFDCDPQYYAKLEIQIEFGISLHKSKNLPSPSVDKFKMIFGHLEILRKNSTSYILPSLKDLYSRPDSHAVLLSICTDDVEYAIPAIPFEERAAWFEIAAYAKCNNIATALFNVINESYVNKQEAIGYFILSVIRSGNLELYKTLCQTTLPLDSMRSKAASNIRY